MALTPHPRVGCGVGRKVPRTHSQPLQGQKCINHCSAVLSDAGRSPSPKARLWDTEMLFMLLHVPGTGVGGLWYRWSFSNKELCVCAN